MSHQVSVDPVADVAINVSNLKERGYLWVPGATVDPDHVRHPPVLAVVNDHRHPRPDVQEYRIGFGFCVTAWEAEVVMTGGSW